jgi:uncharacterized LabA/DUF88 family protein
VAFKANSSLENKKNMGSSNDTVSMAVFCDFENVALGVRDANYEKFDIKPVLERLLLKGSIVVKKAYCDWERYKGFKATMHESNFELIEIPHVRQSGKNSADIRLVVDALDLCYTKSHVNTFVIISGDSDFSPLVSKLRENAKQVIGVGVKQSTSDLLVANCDEFIFYDDLVRESRRAEAKRDERKAQPAKRPAAGTDESIRRKEELDARKTKAIDLAVETFDALVSERGDSGKIWASMLKEAIKRRKPDFSESYYGFRTFGNLLEEAQARGLLEFGRDEKSGAYVYRSSAAAAPAASADGANTGAVEAQVLELEQPVAPFAGGDIAEGLPLQPVPAEAKPGRGQEPRQGGKRERDASRRGGRGDRGDKGRSVGSPDNIGNVAINDNIGNVAGSATAGQGGKAGGRGRQSAGRGRRDGLPPAVSKETLEWQAAAHAAEMAAERARGHVEEDDAGDAAMDAVVAVVEAVTPPADARPAGRNRGAKSAPAADERRKAGGRSRTGFRTPVASDAADAGEAAMEDVSAVVAPEVVVATADVAVDAPTVEDDAREPRRNSRGARKPAGKKTPVAAALEVADVVAEAAPPVAAPMAPVAADLPADGEAPDASPAKAARKPARKPAARKPAARKTAGE